MNQRVLGRTGLSVSPICIGAWQLAGPLSFDGKPDGHPDPGKNVVLRMIRELGDMGINFIDTAEQYGNGESERRVGEAVRGKRDEWIISSKFGYRVGPNGTRNDSSHPSTILTSIEGSLKRLGTDYIDIYLYHCPPNPNELEEGRSGLDKLVQQGKCRFYGISTNRLELIKTMTELDMLHVIQYASNILQDSPEIRAIARKHNLGCQVRGVMAQGRLSGKYLYHQPLWGIHDNRSNAAKVDDFRRYVVFEPFLPEGYTMAQVAIRWILDHSCHHSICLGAKSIEDYVSAIKAVNMPALSEDTREKLATCAKSLSIEKNPAG